MGYELKDMVANFAAGDAIIVHHNDRRPFRDSDVVDTLLWSVLTEDEDGDIVVDDTAVLRVAQDLVEGFEGSDYEARQVVARAIWEPLAT